MLVEGSFSDYRSIRKRAAKDSCTMCQNHEVHNANLNPFGVYLPLGNIKLLQCALSMADTVAYS
jgi:hypothetical protein